MRCAVDMPHRQAAQVTRSQAGPQRDCQDAPDMCQGSECEPLNLFRQPKHLGSLTGMKAFDVLQLVGPDAPALMDEPGDPLQMAKPVVSYLPPPPILSRQFKARVRMRGSSVAAMGRLRTCVRCRKLRHQCIAQIMPSWKY